MSVGLSTYDRWQKKLREAQNRIEHVRGLLRSQKNAEGRAAATAELSRALEKLAYAANSIEDADDSCYSDGEIEIVVADARQLARAGS